MIISAIPCEDIGRTKKEAEDNLEKYGWRIFYSKIFPEGVREINGMPCYTIVKGG
jgi:hypothetical protein